MKTKNGFKKTGFHLVLATLLIGILAGCSSTKVSYRHEIVTGKIPRPETIWVHDFASTASGVPMTSAFSEQATAQQSPATAALNRRVGTELAAELVDNINTIGMFARLTTPDSQVEINDIVIQGYLLTVDDSSATKQVLIGFGNGASRLVVAVEGYQMTKAGLCKLGEGTVNAGGDKTPGTAPGAATFLATRNPAGLIITGGMHLYGEASGSSTIEGRVKQAADEIAGVMKQRFQQQGWIR